MKRIASLAVAAVLLSPLAARAEEEKEAAAPPVTFSGMVDAYYTANLTTSQAVPNPLRAYDGNTGFRLNWAKLVASMDPEPAGFKIDLGFGPESVFTTNFFLLQAYASLKLGPGVLDFGQFTTSAGFELFEAKDNWLYTRGLIYQYIVPTVHQGIRYGFDVAEGVTLQASLSNGWDAPDGAVIDPVLSPYKTGHASIFYAGDAVSAAVSVYYGKEPNAADPRLLVDGNVGYSAGPLSVNLSAAYRKEGDADERLGAALMARYEVSEAVKISGRFEYLDDPEGAALGLADGNAWNATVGASYAVGKNAELRAEVRYDKVSEDYFAKTDSATPELTDGAATAHVAAIAWF